MSLPLARTDLLALSLDDLVAYSNRGTVKRALKEVTENQVTAQIEETPAGEVTFCWSDGRVSTLPAQHTLREGRCTCAAAGICRCLIRAVLAYQQLAAGGATSTVPPADAPAPAESAAAKPSAAAEPAPADELPPAPSDIPPEQTAAAEPEEASAATPVAAAPATANEPWDPGTITDEQLGQYFPKALLTKARKAYEHGELVELIRGPKPQAHFHQRSTTIRFLVPGNPRYFHCDCAEHAQCICVPLAIWAFRQLPADRTAGLVSTQAVAYPVPSDTLSELSHLLAEVLETGFANVPAAWKDRMNRAATQCRKQGLLWPAEILGELLHLHQQYHEHSALFESQALAVLVGELLIRCDAIQSQPPAVPQLLIRGATNDTLTEVASARLTGLGCWVVHHRHSAEMFAFLQDDDSGTLVAVSRNFENPADEQAQPNFARLGRYSLTKGMSLAAIGSSILVIQGAKRTPNRRLVLGRRPAILHTQNYAWEKLRPPVLVDDFAALDAQRATLPPTALRPRRVTEDLYVLEVAQVTDVAYEPVSQTIGATLCDAQGGRAQLRHPYTTGGEAGFEALLAVLEAEDSNRGHGLSAANQEAFGIKYVAGRVQRSGAGLVIAPTCLVFETPQGRMGLQPWVDTAAEAQRILAALGNNSLAEEPTAAHQNDDALATASDSPANATAAWADDASALLGELLLLGARRADPGVVRQWQELATRGESYGYDRLPRLAHRLAGVLERRLHEARWNAGPTVELASALAVALRLAMDMPPP